MQRELRCSVWLLAFALVASHAAADVVLDQQLALSNSFAVEFDSNQELRQTFTVGSAGLVSKFGVQLFRLNDGLATSNDVIVSIMSRFLPATSFYGARVPLSEIPVVNSFSDPVPWTYVDVSRGKRLAAAGDIYGIKMSQSFDSSESATNVYWRASGSELSYNGGQLIRRIPPYPPSEFWANFGDGDGGFQTFVETDAVRRTASFTPLFDVQAEVTGNGPYSLIDGGSEIRNEARTSDPASVEKRGLMEFDLSSLPDNALITAAYLDLEISDFVPGSKATGFSQVSIAGYAGSGVPDASKAALNTPVLESRPAQALGVQTFFLDVKQFETMLAQSDYLGLVTRALPSQFPSGYFTSEQAVTGGFLPPTLRLEYITTDPLPGDENSDGIVDTADYIAWRNRDGTPTDYDNWRRNFGTRAGAATAGAGAASAVPEPSAICAALCLIAFASSGRAGRKTGSL